MRGLLLCNGHIHHLNLSPNNELLMYIDFSGLTVEFYESVLHLTETLKGALCLKEIGKASRSDELGAFVT